MEKKIKVLLLCAFLTVGINSEGSEMNSKAEYENCHLPSNIRGGTEQDGYFWVCERTNSKCGICEDDDAPLCELKQEAKYRYKCCSWKLSFHGCDGTFYGTVVKSIVRLMGYQGMSK